MEALLTCEIYKNANVYLKWNGQKTKQNKNTQFKAFMKFIKFHAKWAKYINMFINKKPCSEKWWHKLSLFDCVITQPLVRWESCHSSQCIRRQEGDIYIGCLGAGKVLSPEWVLIKIQWWLAIIEAIYVSLIYLISYSLY